MLATLVTSFIIFDVIYGEYNYEYYEEFRDNYYDNYAEDYSTFHPGPYPGRVHRFPREYFRPGHPGSDEDVKGALEHILLGREMPDNFMSQITTKYERQPKLFSLHNHYEDAYNVNGFDMRPTRVDVDTWLITDATKVADDIIKIDDKTPTYDILKEDINFVDVVKNTDEETPWNKDWNDDTNFVESPHFTYTSKNNNPKTLETPKIRKFQQQSLYNKSEPYLHTPRLLAVRSTFDPPDRSTFNQPDRSTFNQPDKSKFNQLDRSTPNQPVRSTFNQRDRSTFNQPDRSTFNQPDRSTFNQPDRSTFNHPDKSTFNQSDRSTITQPGRSTKHRNTHEQNMVRELESNIFTNISKSYMPSRRRWPKPSKATLFLHKSIIIQKYSSRYPKWPSNTKVTSTSVSNLVSVDLDLEDNSPTLPDSNMIENDDNDMEKQQEMDYNPEVIFRRLFPFNGTIQRSPDDDKANGMNVNILRTSPSTTIATAASTMLVTTMPTTTSNSSRVMANTTITTLTPTTTVIRYDIARFLAIIANLTYDYDTNLTMQVNYTLTKLRWPTCGTPAPPTTTTTTPPPPMDYSGFNETIIAKCFVCGLEHGEIPYSSNCADAFAGDFIPLVPQDPRARSRVAQYRKYCRFGQIRNFFVNATHPRSMYGEWTGGCAVRWTDVTGVYTQRTCRNRRRPTTGRHFASKRMAKLERALLHEDNGCIISPVATLLPLSRGISLYARFHACVCTGNWCNTAPRMHCACVTRALLLVILAHIVAIVQP